MKNLYKQLMTSLAVVMFFGLTAGNAYAVLGGECMFTFSTEKQNELADQHQVTAQDTVHGETRTLDFQNKTLSTVKPGDIVMAHGEPHVLTQKTQRMDSTHYVFTNTTVLNDHVKSNVICRDCGPGDS